MSLQRKVRLPMKPPEKYYLLPSKVGCTAQGSSHHCSRVCKSQKITTIDSLITPTDHINNTNFAVQSHTIPLCTGQTVNDSLDTFDLGGLRPLH